MNKAGQLIVKFVNHASKITHAIYKMYAHPFSILVFHQQHQQCTGSCVRVPEKMHCSGFWMFELMQSENGLPN